MIERVDKCVFGGNSFHVSIIESVNFIYCIDMLLECEEAIFFYKRVRRGRTYWDRYMKGAFLEKFSDHNNFFSN